MATILNHDLKGLMDRLVRFAEELTKSVSSSTSELSSFDEMRIRSYLGSMSSYLNWVQNEPALDLPESSPKEYEVADNVTVTDVESEIVNDLGRLLEVCYVECLNSQSARRAAGLNPFDEKRVRALIEKATSYLNTYVNESTPLDLPESSPREEVTGPGRTGI